LNSWGRWDWHGTCRKRRSIAGAANPHHHLKRKADDKLFKINYQPVETTPLGYRQKLI